VLLCALRRTPCSAPNSPKPPIIKAVKRNEEESQATGQPARRFKEFQWSTRDSWSRQRRVTIAKAEWPAGEANPRFVVTSLSPGDGEP
jgi:hypothetical protein